MSDIDPCFKCRYFTYNNFSEEYQCISEMFRDSVGLTTAWEHRYKSFDRYDRDTRAYNEVMRVCKDNPCSVRCEKL